MSSAVLDWPRVLNRLEQDVEVSDFNTYLCPLQIRQKECNLFLLAPNHFVLSVVKDKYLSVIQKVVDQFFPDALLQCSVVLGLSLIHI